MQTIQRILSTLAISAPLALAYGLVHAQSVVLFEDPALSADRLHYPLLISEGRGYRISCASQEDEEAIIRGLGFATVPSRIVTAVDEEVIEADPTANPLLCPSAPDFQIQVFANDGPDGLVHYLRFPTAIGAGSYTDRLYIPGCVGLVDALKLDLSQAHHADPTIFFQGKIHEIACLSGVPIQVAPEDFSGWCVKGDRTPAETATVMAMLDATPVGVTALDNPAACASAQEFLRAIPVLNLNGKGVQSLDPLSVLTHLTSLSLAGNQISDLSPLTKLSALTFLDLSNNQIVNISALAPLTSLTRLDLSDNRIEDIRSLAALPLLTSLSLDGNAVLDLAPLQFLQALTDLSLARNNLSGDMLEPLTALGALTSLDLSGNNIESFQNLGEFPSTVAIDLSGNPIMASGGRSFLDLCILHRDSPTPFGQTIRAIVEVHGGGACNTVNDSVLASTTLDLSGKVINDIQPLSVLTHLTNLNLSDNAIREVSALSGLKNLVNLNLSGNSITDIRPIGPLTRLTTFDASGNPISVADFLSACLMRDQENALTETQAHEIAVLLDISGQGICQKAYDNLRLRRSVNASGKGLTTLEYFPVLRDTNSLNLSNNELTDLSALASLPGLTSVWAHNNKIASMSAVTQLRRLERLYLNNNPLNSLNGVTTLNKLRKLHFSNTNVRHVQLLSSLPLLEEARMRGLSLSFASFSEYCLVHRFDSLSLGAERTFMAAVETALDAANVDINDCDAVENWARTVTKLNFNKKSISSVKPLAFFTALRELFLYDNLISNAQPISALRQLRTLNLNANRLTAIPRFLSTQMETLNLDDNKLRSIANLSNLNRLKTLSLHDNDISDPSTVGGFSSLTYLDLRNNNIGLISKARTVLDRKPYLKGNPVCRLRIGDQKLNDACRRDPPLILFPILHNINTPTIISPIIRNPGILTPVNPANP